MLTTINTRWEATQRVMEAKLIRLAHKIAIQLHIEAESCTVCSSRSRRPVWKLLDIPSYKKTFHKKEFECMIYQHRISYMGFEVFTVVRMNSWRRKMEAARFSETLVPNHHTTRNNNPENHELWNEKLNMAFARPPCFFFDILKKIRLTEFALLRTSFSTPNLRSKHD
jgi:hypothetical protein